MAETKPIPDEDCYVYKQILDKLTLKSLYLMEAKMEAEINAEHQMKEGAFHLAKSRYIMGQHSVSALNLPIDSPNGFPATKIVEKCGNESGKVELALQKKESSEAPNPIRWFGLLVPQNLYRAQSLFENALNYVVDSINVKLELAHTLRLIRSIKMSLKKADNIEK